MAIPQWVPGTRLYPLVPPLPVLLESVTTGPPPFRGPPSVYGGVGQRRGSRDRDHDGAVAHRDLVGLDGEVRRQRQRTAGRDVETRSVAWARCDPVLAVEVALAQRPVVVRAAVLERVQLAVAVIDADGQEALDVDDPHRPRRQL